MTLSANTDVIFSSLSSFPSVLSISILQRYVRFPFIEGLFTPVVTGHYGFHHLLVDSFSVTENWSSSHDWRPSCHNSSRPSFSTPTTYTLSLTVLSVTPRPNGFGPFTWLTVFLGDLFLPCGDPCFRLSLPVLFTRFLDSGFRVLLSWNWFSFGGR